MVLNEAVDFDVAADARIRRAFVGGRPETKIKLDAGAKLYKWTQHPLITPKGISPWWHLVDGRLLTNGLWVEGFRQSETSAQRLGISHRDYARYRSAVTQQWNTMSQLLLIGLNASVYGFVGRSFGQLEDETVPDVYTIGGAWQLWIPNLTMGHVREIPALG